MRNKKELHRPFGEDKRTFSTPGLSLMPERMSPKSSSRSRIKLNLTSANYNVCIKKNLNLNGSKKFINKHFSRRKQRTRRYLQAKDEISKESRCLIPTPLDLPTRIRLAVLRSKLRNISIKNSG